MESMAKICPKRMLGRDMSLWTWLLVSYIKGGRPWIKYFSIIQWTHILNIRDPPKRTEDPSHKGKIQDQSHKDRIHGQYGLSHMRMWLIEVTKAKRKPIPGGK